MSIIRFLGLYLKYLLAKFKYRGKVRFNGFTIVYAFPKSSIKLLGGGIIINSSFVSNLVGLYQRTILVARYGGVVEIGENSGISGSTIYAMRHIKIGRDVLIGGNCKIIDNDFHPLLVSQRIPKQRVDDIKKAPIEIGDGCFIGANSIILKGTTIGKNCVVGAGSVVSGNFPDNVIIAGNPARVIKPNQP